ncbi:MAG TPA: TIGR01777 family oxidoreductase [Opitutaceae bacterium]|jgi:uncharacterized protein (TIGR01777 family)|nr:TIGR01777 family oxidoreductase [Opitutaceae bacterium]
MRDEIFSRTSLIARPAAEVFAWHERSGAFERLCPPWERIEVLSRTGGIRDGGRVTLRMKAGPAWIRWEVGHCDYVAGLQFRDVQLQGPFARWEHLHRIDPAGADACTLTDEIHYRLRGGAAGIFFGRNFVRRKLAGLFAYRHAVTRLDLEERSAGPPLCIAVTGTGGLVGRALVPFLQTQGHTVRRLMRRKPAAEDGFFWNPGTGELAAPALEGADAVVHLAGANLAEGRWTAARKAEILRSRVEGTRTLVTALAKTSDRPRVLVSMSATGFYGDRGDEVLEEGSSMGRGFLSDVCAAWEREAQAAGALGVRTVCLRAGVVLTPAGGALARLLPVFRAGLGGRLGSGRQWMGWITIDDLLGVIGRALGDERLRGPVNAVAPGAVRNDEFSRTLALVLHRPAWWPVPEPLLRVAFGEMAREALLAGALVRPTRLAEAGHAFRWPELGGALRYMLGKTPGA